MNIKIFILCFAYLGAFSSYASAQQDQKTEASAHRASKDSLWGYSSEGRELFDVVTSTGEVIKAVDVDGLAYVGDIILGRTSELKLHGLQIVDGEEHPEDDLEDDPDIQKAAIRIPSSGYKWPNGVVPYEYASNLGRRAREAMEYAFNHWHTNTNVRFVKRTNQRDYIQIRGGGGCSSYIGRQGGRQAVTMAEGCGRGAAVHELGHAVGFFHEQSRTDRDSYITIYWGNIQSGLEYNFSKLSTNSGQNHGQYDYYSIMHYNTGAFSKNGSATIWPKQSGVDTRRMGRGSKLTKGDIAAAAAIYGEGGNNNGTTYRGRLTGSRDSDVQPDGDWFEYSGGTLTGKLEGPTRADFELFLYKWDGNNRRWKMVDKSESPTSNESINYSAAGGYYYFRVYSYSGRGNYTFALTK